MDNKFWLYVSLGLPYSIRVFFSLAIAAAWTAAYFRWLKSIGVILLAVGTLLTALLALISGALIIYISVVDPTVSRTYFGLIGVFNTFAPIPAYLLELLGVILIVFRKWTPPDINKPGVPGIR